MCNIPSAKPRLPFKRVANRGPLHRDRPGIVEQASGIPRAILRIPITEKHMLAVHAVLQP
jgi:hypothetical protein